MPYVRDWDTFAAQAHALFLRHPDRFRYTMKYRHKEGKMVLKATDDATALLFETDQAADIKKVEKLNNAFFLAMSTKSLDSLESFAASADLASLAAPSSRGVPTRK